MKRNKKYLLNFLKVKRQLKLRNIPIMYEFVILTGVVFVIIFALSWILLTSFKIDKEKSTLAVVNQTNNQVINKVDEYVSDIINLTKIPLFSDNFISSNSQETFVNELSLFSKTNTSTLEFQKYVGQIAYMIFNSRSYVNSVFVFNLNGKSEYRCYNNAFLPDSIDLNKEMWFKRSIDARGKPFIISTFSLPGYMDSNNAPHYMFSVSRGIMDFTESKVQGNILVNCDIGIFSSFCKKMLIVPNQRIVIINKNGNVVYDTEESNITNKFDSQFYQLVRNGVVGTKKINKNGIKYLVSYNTSELTDWKIVNIVSENELFSNINRTRNFFAVISFFLITLTLFLLLLLSRQIIYPLKKLVHLMKLVERGDFDVKIKMNSRNEFGQLARTFNNMTRRIKRLINEVYVDKIKQKDLELQMLQNQINPHFLYNTLESIHMVAEINNDMEASQMSRSLGRILRYGISSKSQIVTIKQEVDHLNDYILLQKVNCQHMQLIIL